MHKRTRNPWAVTYNNVDENNGIRFYTANQLDKDLFDLILSGKNMVDMDTSMNRFACNTSTSFKVNGDGFKVVIVHELIDERTQSTGQCDQRQHIMWDLWSAQRSTGMVTGQKSDIFWVPWSASGSDCGVNELVVSLTPTLLLPWDSYYTSLWEAKPLEMSV